MNKKIILLLSLVLIAMISLSSCELIVKDPEVDKDTVIVELGEEKIIKEDVLAAIDQIKLYYQLQYGNSINLDSEEYKDSIQQSAIDSLIAEKVMQSKIKELGLDKLSDEEKSAIKTEAEEDYNRSLDIIKNTYFVESELVEDELDNAIKEKADELGYNNVEQLVELKTSTKSSENLRLSIIKDISVSDEELKADYDQKVMQSRINVENKPELYSNYIMNNSPVYYVPAGYRSVKQILVKFSDDDSNEINSLTNKIAEKENQIDTVKASIEEENNAADDNNEEQDSDTNRLDSLNASLKQYEDELTDLNAKLEETKKSAFANIQDKLDKVLAGLDDTSKTFENLIDEYNEDPGMNTDKFKESGYPVSAVSNNYDSNFVEAAMSLKNIGDVSPPTKGLYGYYIIKYHSDINEGPVEFDTVKDEIYKSMLEQKQNTSYNNQIQEWIDEANAKIYLDRMN